MKKTSLLDLRTGLLSLGLPKNHIYIIHSSMLKFGIIENGLKGVMSCLNEVLGHDATILMPAFTLSFGQTRNWDYKTSKSEAGALTEYFRKSPLVERTIHPFHSLSVFGKEANHFLTCSNLSSFGDGSPFDLLYQAEAFNIALGTEFEGGATFLHHTEELARVSYRHYKDFPGQVVGRDGQYIPGPFKMYVREISESFEYENVWDKLWGHFNAEGLVTREKINGANLFAFQIKPTHDNFFKLLQKDPFFCVKKHQLNGIKNE